MAELVYYDFSINRLCQFGANSIEQYRILFKSCFRKTIQGELRNFLYEIVNVRVFSLWLDFVNFKLNKKNKYFFASFI